MADVSERKSAKQIISDTLSEYDDHWYWSQTEKVVEALAAAGYVIVPRDPTDMMIEAGCCAQLHDDEVVAVYREMIDAALNEPQP